MNIRSCKIVTKYIIILLFIASPALSQAQQATEQYLPVGTRLAMGYYYPSLSIVSNPTDIEISLNYWIQELTRSVGMDNVYSVLYQDIEQMNHDFEAGKLDMIIAPPLLIAIHFNRDLLADGFVGVHSIDRLDYLAIITRTEPGKLFSGYMNKRLRLPKNDLLAKVFLETTIIKQYQKPLQSIFTQTKKSTKNQRMVLDLFFNKADIALVYESSLSVILELNPQIATRVSVLERLPMIGRNFGYFHRDFPYQEELKNGIDRFNAKPRGKQILQVFHTSDIKICKVSYLDQFTSLYQEYLTLKKSLRND